MIKKLILLSFIEGAVAMASELCGAKLLAPIFGSSLYVWASVMGITLAALALGYFFGCVVTGRASAMSSSNRTANQVEKLRANNILAVSGDATEPSVLIQAHIARAGMLVIATPDTFDARKMLEIARTLNPGIESVLRTHSAEEAELLQREKAGAVFMGEHELARGMAEHILTRMGLARKPSANH